MRSQDGRGTRWLVLAACMGRFASAETGDVERNTASPTQGSATGAGETVIARDQGPLRSHRDGLLFHPEGPEPLRWRLGVGALLDILPSRVAESEIRQIPQLVVNARLGLPSGFMALGRARSNVIGNELALGIGYSHAFGSVWLGIFDHQGISFGYLGVEDTFSAFVWSLTNTPSLSIGIPWNNVRFSMVVEAFLSFAQHTSLGDSSRTSRQGFYFSGVGGSLVVENLLDAGGIVYFGAGILQAQPDFQAWVAFSDERARLYYPRFMGGYVF